MLLRDDRQMAISDIEALCIETADHLAAAANQTDDMNLKQLFTELALQRRQLAIELAVHIRSLDDLPKTPDPDREQFGDFVTSVKSFFSSDLRGTLLNDRLAAEDRMDAVLDAAQHVALPHPTITMIERIRDNVRMTRRRLQDARGDIE